MTPRSVLRIQFLGNVALLLAFLVLDLLHVQPMTSIPWQVA